MFSVQQVPHLYLAHVLRHPRHRDGQLLSVRGLDTAHLPAGLRSTRRLPPAAAAAAGLLHADRLHRPRHCALRLARCRRTRSSPRRPAPFMLKIEALPPPPLALLFGDPPRGAQYGPLLSMGGQHSRLLQPQVLCPVPVLHLLHMRLGAPHVLTPPSSDCCPKRLAYHPPLGAQIRVERAAGDATDPRADDRPRARPHAQLLCHLPPADGAQE